MKNLSVGEQNSRTALALLPQENLRLTSQDISGALGRKLIIFLIFSTDKIQAWRRIGSHRSPQALIEENGIS